MLNNHRLWTTYVNLGTFCHKNYFQEEKKNLLFLVFSRIYITFLHDQYINRYLLQLSVAETYRKHSFKHANYFNVSSNYKNEQIFAEHLPKVIVSSFHHNVRMFWTWCAPNKWSIVKMDFLYLLTSIRTQNVGFWYWQEGQLKT